MAMITMPVTFGSCRWWSWCRVRFVMVMITMPLTFGSCRRWLLCHVSVRNGDDHDAITVRLVLAMVSVATNSRVAAYWWWSSATSLKLFIFLEEQDGVQQQFGLQCVVQSHYERAGNEFNIYVSRLSWPRIQPCFTCGLCNMRHTPQTVLMQSLARVLTDVNIFMWNCVLLKCLPHMSR